MALFLPWCDNLNQLILQACVSNWSQIWPLFGTRSSECREKIQLHCRNDHIYRTNQLASPKLAFLIYLSNFCDKFGFGLDRGQTVDRPWNAHCGAWKVHFGTWKGHSGTWTGVPHITPKNIRICLGLALDHRPSKLSKIRALFQG